MANEKRLIDANELRLEVIFAKSVLATDKAGEWTRGYRCGLESMFSTIEDQPTVDAVEVPCRCKDCRKCSIYDDVISRVTQYVCCAQNGHREVDADAFCSYGERRGGE